MSLVIHSALVPALPLAEAAKRYGEITGELVEVKAGRPERWMPKLEAGEPSDLISCGAEFLLDLAQARGLVVPESRMSLGLRRGALVVPTGNPANIRVLADLATPGVRVAIAVEGCTLGLWDEVCGRARLTDAVRPNIVKLAQGCGALLGALSRGEVDVAIGWDSFDRHPRFIVQSIPIPDELAVFRSTGIASLARCEQPERAQAFLAWLHTEPARAIYRRWGWIVS